MTHDDDAIHDTTRQVMEGVDNVLTVFTGELQINDNGSLTFEAMTWDGDVYTITVAHAPTIPATP
jgi:hypothetical protein